MTLAIITILLLTNIAAIGFLFIFVSGKLWTQLETSNKILKAFVEKDPVKVIVNSTTQSTIDSSSSSQRQTQKEDDLKVSIDPNEFLKIMGNVK